MFPHRVFQLSPRRARDNVLLFSLALWFTPTTLFGSDVLVGACIVIQPVLRWYWFEVQSSINKQKLSSSRRLLQILVSEKSFFRGLLCLFAMIILFRMRTTS